MKGTARRALVLVAALATLATLAATASARVEARGAHAASAYKLGVVYSRTGPLAAYGAEYVEGLRLGLKYATHGTNKVKGHPIQLTLQDDAGNPATAVSAAKDLIGQGYKIIMGSTSSAVALQVAPLADQNRVLFISGPAASDAITGVNRYTFRSGRQSYQDVLAANSFLKGKGVGRKIVVFAQDYAFGQGNVAAVKAVLGGKGHSVSSILVPLTANDFTPFAQQAKEAKPDLLFVAWAGNTTGAMWEALQQQGVFDATTVTTGLAERATWQSYGPASARIKFLSHYVWNAPKNKVNNWLVAQMKQRGQLPDLFTPDGFNAALMVVHALQKGNDDPDKMVDALAGWKFTGPKGANFIRPQDHALIQPMFQVALVKGANGKFTDKVLKVISPGNVQPPLTPFK